jgi:hypothetical protein
MTRRVLLLGVIGLVAGALAARPRRAEAARPIYHPGHNCPRCGRLVLPVAAFRRGGGHYHVCGQTWWFHY